MKTTIKVLIVEDDRNNANALSEIVKRMGFKPVVASKPIDGLNIAKMQTVHAAIIDVMLPKMSGVDLADEFRKTRFGDAPIVFISGVFKDKSFAQESIARVQAIDFLFKPYDTEALMALLTKAVSSVTSEKWSLNSLIMRRLTSVRERTKAVENLEPIRGNDVPVVLCLLMEAGISGSLNLVSDAGEIFGITLVKGAISEVDSAESKAAGVLNLITNGYLAQEDWDAFEKLHKNFSLERLVSEGLVSPHAIAVAKHEQILADFKALLGANNLQLSFARQDVSEDAPKHALAMPELMNILASSMEEFFPLSYLVDFYNHVRESSIQLNVPAETLHKLWQSEPFATFTGLREAVEKGGTLSAALTRHADKTADLYACVHYLALSRAIIFDDVQVAQSLNKMVERYRDLYKHLNGKSADQIFRYFGAPDKPGPSVCEKIYADYLKSNGPDQLPKEAPAELVNLAKACFTLITDAKDIMTDEEKRTALFESHKSAEAQRLKRSNELTAQGLQSLRKGQFAQSLELLKQAEGVQPTNLNFLIQTWAEVKSGGLTGKPDQIERARRLEALSPDEKKSAYFLMVMGLVKRAMGDAQANSYFERVLEVDPAFLEARRELNSSGAAAKAQRKMDILNGDITDIVSQFFRRKAD